MHWPAAGNYSLNHSLTAQVRQSSVEGRGVFAVQPIAEGTVIGAYPGRPRSAPQMAAKCEAAPGARSYAFRTRSGMLLDPTDFAGRPSNAPAPGLPWPPAACTLAYVNEPPRGAGGTNVTVEDDPRDSDGLLCVAARDVHSGEEIYMDYGPIYDRTSYGRVAAADCGGEEVVAGGEGQQEMGDSEGQRGAVPEQVSGRQTYIVLCI